MTKSSDRRSDLITGHTCNWIICKFLYFASLAWKCIFTLPFGVGRFYQVNGEAYKRNHQKEHPCAERRHDVGYYRSWRPFGHNRHGPKIGGFAPLGEVELGLSLGLHPYQVSPWSIQPFGHNSTNVTDRQDRQRSDGIGRTVLQTVAQKSVHLCDLCAWRRYQKDRERKLSVTDCVFAETTHVVGSKSNFAWGSLREGVVLTFKLRETCTSYTTVQAVV